MHLLIRKYEEATGHRYKLAAYQEFLYLQKTLLREAYKDRMTTGNDLQQKCPLIGIDCLKRIEIYDDELIFPSK